MLERPGRRGSIRWPRSSVNRIALLMGACGFALILGASVFIAAHEREIAFREARLGAQGAAFSLADHASRLFEVADLALRSAAVSLGDRTWEEAEASRSLWLELKTTSDVLPYIRDLLLTDDGGRLRLGSMAFPTPDVDMSDRPAFATARGGAGGLILGEPIIGRITGKPSFLIARRLVDANGHFRGMTSATADLDYFTSYWRQLDLPNDTHVALVRADGGQVLARLPEVSPIAATSIPALRAAASASPLAGRYPPAPDRLGFYRRVGELPLYLTVSYSEAAIEATWLSWLWVFLLFPAAAIAAILAILALARRQAKVEALAAYEVQRARGELASANQRLEQRVAERTADLRESNAEVQRFAYIVSHDLRAPLVNIMGFTSELQRLRNEIFPATQGDAVAPPPPTVTPSGHGIRTATTLRDDFDEAIGFIKTSIDKMDRLIKAILLLARQGQRVFDPEPVDMGMLMRSVADGVAHRAQSSATTVTIAALPPLTIDRIAVEQVFSNLIDNAVKYLQPGVPGRIEVTADVIGNKAGFRVSDNGRGIPPGDHDRVFELFRRSGPQTQPGDGIGLAHVRTLVRQLGGNISLESSVGRGSTFTVLLPLAPEG